MPFHARRLPGIVSRSALEIVVVSNPATPDRTAAIKGTGPSPLPWLADSAALAARLGAATLAYPCNTAHYFLHRAGPGERGADLPLVDMIHETVAAVARAGHRRVGLLGTTGTVDSRLYQDAFEAGGVEVLVPAPAAGPPAEPEAARRAAEALYARHGARPGRPLEPAAFAALAADLVERLGEQDGLVMEAIVGALGVKAGHTAGVPAQLAAEAGRRVAARGARALVLGCTELPLLLTGPSADLDGRAVPLVDPTAVVAARLLAGPAPLGVAGGLGPEATIDLLGKLGAPRDLLDLLYDVLRATVTELGARRDQDHMKQLVVAAPDPVDAALRLARAGADFLVLTSSAADAAAAVAAATGLTVLVDGGDRRVGAEVVRQAVAAAP